LKTIGGLLGRSPFGPLHELMVKSAAAVEELPALMAALARGRSEEVAEIARRVEKIEREADEVKSEIRDNLSKSLFTLADRAETLRLVSGIDAIADDALRAARLVSVRKLAAPGRLGEEVIELAERARDAARRLREILALLGRVIDEGGGDARGVLDMISSLSEVDSEVEDLEPRVLRTLFSQEEELGPTGVMLMMHVLKQLADTARRSENVADVIRRFVLNR
jgi:predicted phosphate transport protein (TIGR00153 family)